MGNRFLRRSCKSALIVGWRSIKLLPASSIHSARLALTGDCSGWLFRTFFAPTATFSPTKIRWHDRHQEWIKGSRAVAWRVVTSQWSFQETQIKLEYWRYLHCGTVAWHIVTSQWIFEETQLSATAKRPAAPPDTRMEFVWWPESLLYNNHRLRSNSFINQLPSS